VDAPVEVRLIGDDIAGLKEQGEKVTAYLQFAWQNDVGADFV
jgi:hypothetical protein